LTPLLHERLVAVGTAAKSFQAGAQVFFSFTRTPVSEPSCRRYTERAGAVMEECESEQFPPEPWDPEDRRPRWIGADGVFVRLVGGAWREVRTVSIGVVQTTWLPDGQPQVRTTDLSYFSRLTEGAEAFIELAGVECRRRGLGEASLVAAGADGAAWCQQLFDRYCPDARRSLDFYHAAARVHTFSKTLWPGDEAASQWYAGEHLHSLKHAGPERLLASLGTWTQVGADPAVRKVAQEQLNFFGAREELLDYPGLRAAGLPIGTGNAESANVHVIQARLKGPGKFWGIEHVNPMLALRGAFCSQRWEQAWSATSARLAAGHYPVHLFHAPKAKI
jgi:hypothetical protein